MTRKIYLEDAEMTTMHTQVTALTVVNNQPVVRLAATPFHPRGGGQRDDTGWIRNVRVVGVRHGADGEVDHFVQNFGELHVGMEVALLVDQQPRKMNARLHSAGHLLAHVVEEMGLSLRATAGHHWLGEARVEFAHTGAEGAAAPTLNPDEVAEHVNRYVAADVAIGVEGDPYSSRSIRIGDFPPTGCGGTHVSSTGEIGRVVIRGIAQKKGIVRIGYELPEAWLLPKD